MIKNVDEFKNCLAAQTILHDACLRLRQEQERQHAICAETIFTFHFIRFFRASRDFKLATTAFRRLNNAFLYLVQQNVANAEGT